MKMEILLEPTSNKLMVVFQNPLFLHPSDGPGSLCVQEKLEGAQNYQFWRRSIKTALSTKRKMGFIKGMVLRSTDDAALQEEWENYASQRSQVLLMSPLPSVESPCALLQQEESRRGVFGSISHSGIETTALYRKSKTKEKCSICGYKWQPEDKFFLISMLRTSKRVKIQMRNWIVTFLQDLVPRKVLGPGKKKAGLYHLLYTPLDQIHAQLYVMVVSALEDYSLYSFFSNSMPNKPSFSVFNDSYSLWHHRLGHVSYSTLKHILCISNVSKTSDDTCLSCPMEMTTLPHAKKAINCYWIFKTKLKADGSMDKKKARLVVNENRQRKGIDYEETFAPISKMVTVKALLAIAAMKGFDVCQMDVSNTFLHGDLFKEVYMKCPPGYVGHGESVKDIEISSLVCKLKKSLYGLNLQNGQGIFISQKKYTTDLLKENGVLNAKPYKLPMDQHVKLKADKSTHLPDPEVYRRLIDKLIYLTITRPDICYIVQLLSQFMQNPTPVHMQAMKHLLRYLLSALGQDVVIKDPRPVDVKCDNQAAIRIVANPVFHARIKHIEVDCHYENMICCEEESRHDMRLGFNFFSSTMGTINSVKPILTQSALDALCKKYYIPDVVHPELPGRNDRICNSLTGKIGVYIRFFDFANYRIPLSRFFVDILEYFQINLSQLSVIAAAKVEKEYEPEDKEFRGAGITWATNSGHAQLRSRSSFGSYSNSTLLRSRPDLWQDIRLYVLIPNASTDALEVNGQDCGWATEYQRQNNHAICFTCKAMIIDIKMNREWHYTSCSQCTKKVTDQNGEYECKDHGQQVQPTYRYNLKSIVTYETANANFIFFTPADDKVTRKPTLTQGTSTSEKIPPGVVRFGKWGKLNPRYVRPFKVLMKVGAIAYKLELPQELSRVHNTFHVSNLKKCYSNDPLVVSLEGLQLDAKLYFVEEPIKVMDRKSNN
nr:hypothetical protein [Tanacetum cinerariifolium]